MRKETKQRLLLMTFILSLALVWGQSCISKVESQTASDTLVDIIKPLEEIKPDEVQTVEYEYYNHLVRKGAHVAEFSIIGVELALLIIVFSKKKLDTFIVFINSVMAGMMIGLIDETIQIFSNRGTQVSDVWFDVLGAGLGASVISIVYAVKRMKLGLTDEKNIDNRR